MKVKICTGSKCTFYGASQIIDNVLQLQEDLRFIPGMPENAELEVEFLPCQEICKDGNHGVAPIVYVDDHMITKAKSEEITELIIDSLKAAES